MNNETQTLEVMPPEAPSVIQALESASMNTQLTYARQHPRDLAKFKAKALSLATLDEETAEGCSYTLNRKEKDGGRKLIQGPSIRAAEIVAYAFGNLRIGSRIVSNDGKYVVCQGICVDLENNNIWQVEASRRITNKEGRTYSEDMIQTTINAASAIAQRNAILKVIPLVLIKPIMDAAKKVAVGDVKSLSSRRTRVISRLTQMGAAKDSILAAVDCSTIEEVTVDKLEILIGLGTSLKDGDTTLEEAFPAVGGKLHSRGATKAPEPPQDAPAPEKGPGESPPIYDAPAGSYEPTPEPADRLPPQPAPVTTPEPAPAPLRSPQERVMSLVFAQGYTFAELVTYILNERHMIDPPKGPEGIPTDLAERYLRNQRGLITALQRGRVL